MKTPFGQEAIDRVTTAKPTALPFDLQANPEQLATEDGRRYRRDAPGVPLSETPFIPYQSIKCANWLESHDYCSGGVFAVTRVSQLVPYSLVAAAPSERKVEIAAKTTPQTGSLLAAQKSATRSSLFTYRLAGMYDQ
jgi:hypothetical protein